MSRGTSDTGGSADPPTQNDPAPSSQPAELPPLPDLPPVAPTLVERGDTQHYREVAQRQRDRVERRG
ncbi:MAG: hypothetical protein OXH86_09085 [Acidimicrobiaceae bacterium]|nr:hypothetical protein [Acidimicrobiaceae bacterium]MDE0497494.1 hypothetical protein [Acidimicrobiaceae bacterium]